MGGQEKGGNKRDMREEGEMGGREEYFILKTWKMFAAVRQNVWGSEGYIDEPSQNYHIAPGKYLWVLTAQAPKIEGGWLHRESYMYPRARAHPGCDVICQGVPS